MPRPAPYVDSMVAPTSIARAHGGVWESIPFTGGLVRNIHNGRVVHEQHFAKNKAANEFLASSKTHTDAADLFYDGTRRNPVTPQGRAPPTIHLRCHDIAGATHPTTVSIEPELVWREVLDKLQEAFGRRTLFEFQDNKGKLVRVDDEHKWMHFCANADNVVPSGMQPTLDVFVSEWRYQEPLPAGPICREDNALGQGKDKGQSSSSKSSKHSAKASGGGGGEATKRALAPAARDLRCVCACS